MSPFKQSLGNAKLAIACLCVAMILSFALNIFLGVMLYSVPKNMTVFVPNRIATGGQNLKADQISNPQVYQFAYGTITNLLTWDTNASKAFPKKIKANSPYISGKFQNYLKAQGTQMQSAGFLFGHTQITYGVNGSSFNPKNVKYIGNHTWLVKLVLRSVNYVASANGDGFAKAHVASDTATSYVLKISKFPIIKGFNETGLRIDGYAITPKQVKVYQ